MPQSRPQEDSQFQKTVFLKASSYLFIITQPKGLCKSQLINKEWRVIAIHCISTRNELRDYEPGCIAHEDRSSVNLFDFSSYLGNVPSGTAFTVARKPNSSRIAAATAVAVSAGFMFVDSIWMSSSSNVSVP